MSATPLFPTKNSFLYIDLLFFKTQKTQKNPKRKLYTYLMVFFSDFAWDTLTLVATVETAGTVSTAALNQEATWPENGIGSL